ncbi:hypothetical protein CYMTET_3659 [Cymbomonas tetramitiformis]|uniref:spermidine synthase n=1 Tax=Cymbomonas tetramitiformis TaxID=36881 RepID=A0AAE0H2N9_9CHLO|nr:hypothetical protein CYMTET_3659 [Cymbomonas tetramitiformis]|eukprot:gene8014-9523_t
MGEETITRPGSAVAVNKLSQAEFNTRFSTAWQSTQEEVNNRFKVGQKVEALSSSTTKDEYGLFYVGSITKISEDSSLDVLFEDGSTEENLSPFFVRPFGREVLYESGEVIVVDGHIARQGVARRARLLSFKSSPQLVQSAVMLDEDGAPCHRQIPFEQHQVLCLSLVMAKVDDASKRSRFLIIGSGGGTLPMAMHTVFPTLVDMDVVEISKDVVKASSQFFKVQVNDNLRIHTQDGARFLETSRPAAYDVLLLDAADPETPDCGDSEDGLEVPPPQFVEPAFLKGAVRRALTSDGICVYNVIAGRSKLVQIAHLFEEHFASVYVLGTDPNYFFWGFVKPKALDPDGIVEMIEAMEPLDTLCKHAMEIINSTEENIGDKTLLGWFTVEQFVLLCEDPTVMV